MKISAKWYEGILVVYLLFIGVWSSLVVAFNIPDLASLPKPESVTAENVAALAVQRAALRSANQELADAQKSDQRAAAFLEIATENLTKATGAQDEAAKTAAQEAFDQRTSSKEEAEAVLRKAESTVASLSEGSAEKKDDPVEWDFIFGKTEHDSIQSLLLLLAFFSGMAGSFIHAAQSLASYLGNNSFARSWFVWYLLRPWVGGVLGLAVFVVFSAGLVGQSNVAAGDINIYGVVALALLGGWFSKTTSDKLQEVLETLFNSNADAQRDDKLKNARPRITSCDPDPVPAKIKALTLLGTDFKKGIEAFLDGTEVAVTEIAENKLTLDIKTFPRPAAGTKVGVTVKNAGDKKVSEKLEITFE